MRIALLLLFLSFGALAAPSGPPDRTWPDGSQYWGALRFDLPHGRGYLTSPDGRVYEGDFAGGKFHGQGFLRMPDGQEYRGRFTNGLYDPPAPPDPLLAKALAALEPSRPGQIDLYLLAVAGDGSQEVFRREVEFVREQFDRDFGTRGRSIALINSRSTAGRAPGATVDSIRESLRAIAARMDRDEDILFLFMTSHGSKSHEFLLSQGGKALPGVKPRELAEMLDDARIRWKVVLVSACYSGGFVEPLPTGKRLTDVPVRCVKDLHRSNRANGSFVPGASTASLWRVAQEGNGKPTSSATGMCGC